MQRHMLVVMEAPYRSLSTTPLHAAKKANATTGKGNSLRYAHIQIQPQDLGNERYCLLYLTDTGVVYNITAPTKQPRDERHGSGKGHGEYSVGTPRT